MQFIVRGISWAMQKTLKTSGAETLSVSANIFVGQTEAPLMIRPYVDAMTKSELMAVMVGGFATVAGGIMAIYVFMLSDVPGIAGHLLAASIMSAPAALVIAKIMYPETEEPATKGYVKIEVEKTAGNAMESISQGATSGLKLAANVAAMLIAFVAMVAMINAFLGLFDTSLEEIFGIIFRPLAWTMGAPWNESATLGTLMGTKIVFTELIGYTNLSEMLISNNNEIIINNIDESIKNIIVTVNNIPKTFITDSLSIINGHIINLRDFETTTEAIRTIDIAYNNSDGVINEVTKTVISKKTAIIASYALCGFANFASIGIQLGGIGGIAPNRRKDLAKIAFKAMIGGALASWLTATIAGILI
jgi:CNT family concentrative nucleoside transporter